MVPDESRIKLAVGEHFRRTRETLGWTLSDVTERAAREGANISVSMLSRLERGQSALSIGDVAALCRSLGTSFAFVEDVIRLAAQRESLDLTGKTYQELIDAGKGLAYRGEFSKAIAHFEAALDFALLRDKGHDPDEIAQALIWCSDIHRRERRFSLAMELVSKVLNLKGCSADNRARALTQNVAILSLNGEFGRAQIYGAQLRLLLKNCSAGSKAYALSALGVLNMMDEAFEQAMNFLLAARKCYLEMENLVDRYRTEATIGFVRAKLGEWEQGLSECDAVAADSFRNKMPEVGAQALRYSGRILLELKRHSEARNKFESAAATSRKLNRTNDLFIAWYWIWKVELDAGNATEVDRIAVTLKRLLRRVDAHLPEAEEFVAATSGKRRAGATS